MRRPINLAQAEVLRKGRAKSPWSLIATRARAAQRQEAIDTLDERMVEAKCRRLTGREFERRAAQLEREARGRARRDAR
jgi:hypothetical protein